MVAASPPPPAVSFVSGWRLRAALAASLQQLLYYSIVERESPVVIPLHHLSSSCLPALSWLGCRAARRSLACLLCGGRAQSRRRLSPLAFPTNEVGAVFVPHSCNTRPPSSSSLPPAGVPRCLCPYHRSSARRLPLRPLFHHLHCGGGGGRRPTVVRRANGGRTETKSERRGDMLFAGHKRRGNFAQFLHLIGGRRKQSGGDRGVSSRALSPPGRGGGVRGATDRAH